MLPLDAPEWSLLQHAYGQAFDVPERLRQLAADPAPRASPDAEPWFSLWSCLCHQGDAYTASYAAVPHIVGIALAAAGPIDFSFFLLPALVELARHQSRAPELPENLAGAYLTALAKLHDCAFAHANEPWDRYMTISILAALAVAKGHAELTDVLLWLDDDRINRILDGALED